MLMQRLRTVAGMLAWVTVFSLAGCQVAQQPAPMEVKAAAERADVADEARKVAEESLGKQAEILAEGALAQNGREQVLAVNRFSPKPAAGGKGADSSAIFVTRAAILEKEGGNWSEVFLCDEHLKNPNGYLGGSPAAHVSSWRLEFNRDAKEGLEMKLTPADRFDAVHANTEQNSGQAKATFDVRWNKNAKRYQSYDQSQERFLSEVPSLETPQSTLR